MRALSSARRGAFAGCAATGLREGAGSLTFVREGGFLSACDTSRRGLGETWIGCLSILCCRPECG